MKHLNILILEDELIIYLHIQSTLKEFGFENIFLAKDYETAIKIATQTKIDILFSDIKIKGNIDGIDTSKQIQSMYNNPIIFITAYDDEYTLKKVSQIDFAGYLLKPFRKEELKALIYMTLNKYNLIDNPDECIFYENYCFNKKEQKLFDNDKKEIKLSKKEKLFTTLLFNNLNKTISYSTIDSIVWEGNYVNDNARRTFIHRYKNKFKNLNIKIDKNIGIGLFSKM